MSIVSALRGIVVVTCSLYVCWVPSTYGQPASPGDTASVRQVPLKTLLADIPHVGANEVETLSPRDQERFVTIVLGLREKYKSGITPLPGQFVNILGTDKARLGERDAYLAKSKLDYENFVREVVALRQQFGFISASEAKNITARLLAKTTQGRTSVQLAAVGATGSPSVKVRSGASQSQVRQPPTPQCGQFPYPAPQSNPNITQQYVCVCSGFPNAGWEESFRQVDSINECGEKFVNVRAEVVWASLTTRGGKVCHHKMNTQKNFSRFMRKSKDLKCASTTTSSSSSSSSSSENKLRLVPGSCDGGYDSITTDYGYRECPAGSKRELEESVKSSIVSDVAKPPTCSNPSWVHTTTSSGPTSGRTYKCDGTCIGCPPPVDGP